MNVQKYRNTEIQKYRNTEIQKYRNTEIQKYRNTFRYYCLSSLLLPQAKTEPSSNKPNER